MQSRVAGKCLIVALRNRFANHGGASGDVPAELASFLGHIDFLHAGRRQLPHGLHQPAQNDRQERHGDDDASAWSSAGAEGQEPEVATGDLNVVTRESLGHEPPRLVPVLGVVGNPPGIHQDLALGGDVVARELGLVEVHVGDEKGDGHVQVHHFLDEGCQVWQLIVVGVELRDQVTLAERVVQLLANARLDVRVVHKLCHSPLDGPEHCLDRGDVDVLDNVQQVVLADFPLPLCFQDEVDRGLFTVGLGPVVSNSFLRTSTKCSLKTPRRRSWSSWHTLW